MKVKSVILNNVRSFKGAHAIDCSVKINILIGPNNSGKSTVLNSIFSVQRDVFSINDLTVGEDVGLLTVVFDGAYQPIHNATGPMKPVEFMDLSFRLANAGLHKSFNNPTDNFYIPQQEPLNIVYPYLSKRKVSEFYDSINANTAQSVLGSFQHLYAKIDRLNNPDHSAFELYRTSCKEILGFVVSSIAKGDGKHAVYIIDDFEHIGISSMGEGVANILGLLTDLCVAKNKIFLIEEPENDIHPSALKALLKLITEKANTNQFFISTHSNIVLKHLGAVEHAKIFKVSNDGNDEVRKKMFLSKINEVPNTPEDRRKVLEELGYDLWDYDLWRAWLFLEESSAEFVIREYLIKWFVPELAFKLRTFAAEGFQSVEKKLDDFYKLFVFLHLQPTYKDKVWVVLDGGREEGKVINTLREKFSVWKPEQFSQFSAHDFEKYYPSEFATTVKAILDIGDKQVKRRKKKILLDEVKDWVKEDENRAKKAFLNSAAEVIEVLKSINKLIG